MRRVLSVILSLILFLCIFPVAGADSGIIELPDRQSYADASFSEEHVIVKLASNSGIRTTTSDIPDLGVALKEARLINPSADVTQLTDGLTTFSVGCAQNCIFVLTLENPGRESVLEAIEILNANPLIEYAEPNFSYEPVRLPNDPYFSDSRYTYAYYSIRLPDAWEYTTGSHSVVVGVIDTGLDGWHADIMPNLWRNPSPNTGMYYNDVHGYDFYARVGGIPFDSVSNGHGTHVAGTIGMKGNNANGFAGVNWDVSIAWLGAYMPARNTFSLYAIIEAINYAGNNNIPILNNSYGGADYSRAMEDTIRNYPGLFVVAAGNDGRSNDIYANYPSNYNSPNIVAVANVNSSDRLTGDSNYGERTVHIAAPGHNILSSTPGNRLSLMSGTSMAAPHVSGVAALVLSVNPGISTAQLKDILLETARPVSALTSYVSCGGIVDAHAAVTYQVPLDPLDAFVIRLYNNVLRRPPDPGEVGIWAARLRSGVYTGASAAYGFFSSDEFLCTELSNVQYTDIMYSTVLGRAPSPEESAIWVERLDSGMARDTVLSGFIGSPEFVGLCAAAGIAVGNPVPPSDVCIRFFVARLYIECLGRAPDAAGLNAWASSLKSGAVTGTAAAQGFFFSVEMNAKGLDDRAFVNALYGTMLGRRADEPGMDTWLSLMQSGWNRDRIFRGFADSAEFGDICRRYGIRR